MITKQDVKRAKEGQKRADRFCADVARYGHRVQAAYQSFSGWDEVADERARNAIDYIYLDDITTDMLEDVSFCARFLRDIQRAERELNRLKDKYRNL